MFKFLYKLWGRLGFLPFLDKLEPMPKDLLQDEFKKETLRLGRIISISLIIIYSIFIFASSFSVESNTTQTLITSHTISLILLAIFFVITYLPSAHRFAIFLSVLASLIPITNVLHRFYILQEPVVTVSLIMGLLILATVALDVGWLACVVMYACTGWLFVIWLLGLPFVFTLVYYAVVLSGSSIATITICRMRHRSLRNYSNLRWHESLQRQELESAQENLEAQNAELAHVDRLKSAFLANMSHEFRTPLTAISGFTEVLETESFGPLNEKQKNYLSNISVSGKQLLGLVNNILALSSFEADQVPFKLSQNSISEVISNVLSVLKQDIDKTHILISQSFDAKDNAYFDSVTVSQVMLNLLNNAIKFSETHSVIEIKTYNTDTDTIIEIKDSGIGISEEDQSLLFLPFSQVDSSFNRSHEGAGLGLALSKKIIEKHGGEIFVRSKLGEGSTFGFSLPKSLAEKPIEENSPLLELKAEAGELVSS